MPIPEPVPGLVIGYSYLWREQGRAGENAGRKDRPCVIVAAAEDEEGDLRVYVAPVTHARPDDPHAVELPLPVKRRLGLDDRPSWVVTGEMNHFIWPGFDLRPVARNTPDMFAWGFLPVETFSAIKRGILMHGREKRLEVLGRE